MAKKDKDEKKEESKKKKDSSKEREESVEVFEVENEKTGEDKTVVKKSKTEKEHADKKELKRYDKQLKTILWVFGVVIVFIFVVFWISNLAASTDYKGIVEFKEVREGDLTFYNTEVPLYDEAGEQVNEYNFYLRTHPDELEEVPFEGDYKLKKGYALNMTEEFRCNGYGNIAFANLIKQHDIARITFIKDDKASCDDESRYNYFEIKSGDETKVVQRQNEAGEGISCYDVYVNSCEILPATEKIMAENFILFKDLKILFPN